MAMIEASRLSKNYAGRSVIDRVSFSINEGEIVGLLGLNGAGKSTILKMLGCFLLPSGGTATVAGFDVDSDPQQIRRQIGYLPDTPPLYDEMTVESYLQFVARLKNVANADVDSSVRRAMDKTNLAEVSDYRLGELSHGFRQRVGIAQALVHNPKVLILDEPINGLDPVQIVEMRDLIVSLKGQHTVILSSHILSEITKTCDRILVIDRGRLVAEGSEAELEKQLTKSMRLFCEVDRSSPELVAALRAVNGVSSVKEAPGTSGVRLIVETASDVRATIAQTIVKSSSGLLGMTREDAGLEGLFMQLVKTAESNRASEVHNG